MEQVPEGMRPRDRHTELIKQLNQGIMYKMKQAIVGALLLLGTALFAQSGGAYRIQGVITDNGEPVPALRVELFSDTAIHAFTDERGGFHLEVPTPDVQLKVKQGTNVKKVLNVQFSGNENRLTYVEADLGTVVELEAVQILDNPSLVTNTRHALQRDMDVVPGAVVLMDLSALRAKRSQTLKDAIGEVPGVLVQDFFGGNDQPRLNIRGSGIQSNPQTRGVALLQDGIPVNLTDGSYVIGLLEPQAAHLVQVYKGANALRYGYSTLGGAINFITRNGYNASPLAIKLEGGSFGYLNASISSGTHFGKNDVFVAASHTRSDGYREWNASDRTNVLVNLGRRFSKRFESRLFVNYTDLGFNVSGPLTYGQIMDDPRQVNTTPTPRNVGPNVLRDKPRRGTEAFRVASKNVLLLGEHGQLEAKIYYQHMNDVFVFPIATGVRDNASNDMGGGLLYTLEAGRNKFMAGADAASGLIDSRYYTNNAGVATALIAKNDLRSSRLSIYANDVYAVLPRLDLVGAVQASWDNRIIAERMDDPTNRPIINFMQAAQGGNLMSTFPSAAVNKDYHYFGFTPKVGAIYKPNGQMQVFANFSLSYEPPTFIELMLLEGGTPNSSANKVSAAALEAQQATTLEAGYRGKRDRLSWDLSIYRSNLSQELLTITDQGLFTGHTVNASAPTIHQGLELAVGLEVLRDVFKPKDQVRLRANYTYSDFRFTEGNYRDNRIAGVPVHYVVGSVEYSHPTGVTANINLESIPESTPISHRNDLYQRPYSLLNVRLGYQRPRWGMYVEGRNLLDQRYAASYLVIDHAVVPPLPGADKFSTTSFVPGMGRNIIAGVSYTL